MRTRLTNIGTDSGIGGGARSSSGGSNRHSSGSGDGGDGDGGNDGVLSAFVPSFRLEFN